MDLDQQQNAPRDIQTTKLDITSICSRMVSFLCRSSLICDIWWYLCITWSPRRLLRLCMYIHSLTFESNYSHRKIVIKLCRSGMCCALQHVVKLRLSNCVTCVPLQPQTYQNATCLHSWILRFSLIVFAYISQKNSADPKTHMLTISPPPSESFTDLWSSLQYWCNKITIKKKTPLKNTVTKHHKICKYTIKNTHSLY